MSSGRFQEPSTPSGSTTDDNYHSTPRRAIESHGTRHCDCAGPCDCPAACLRAAGRARALWRLRGLRAELPAAGAAPAPRLHHARVPGDLLLCKGLDLAERAFPCLTATPTEVCKAMAFCACGVPAGACCLSMKFACKALRSCLCDIPAVACGLPSLLCCSTAELCLCDAPAALCGIPGKITLKAAHTALGDVESIVRTLEACSDHIVGQFRSDDRRDC